MGQVRGAAGEVDDPLLQRWAKRCGAAGVANAEIHQRYLHFLLNSKRIAAESNLVSKAVRSSVLKRLKAPARVVRKLQSTASQFKATMCLVLPAFKLSNSPSPMNLATLLTKSSGGQARAHL